MSKKIVFSDFLHILALKYQAKCQLILNIYSLYKNTTIREQNKTKYCKHLLKTAVLPPIEAYFAIS